MVINFNFKNYTIKLSPVSVGFWQSEIWDSQQRLVGCTCDRAPDSSVNRAKKLVTSFLFS